MLFPALMVLGQAPRWATYTSPVDGITILMPGPTRVQVQKTQGVTTDVYLAFAPPFLCGVTKTILPPGTKPTDVAKLGAGMKRTMMAASQSTPTGERAASYAGLAGRETDFRSARGGAGATWIARTPKAVYSLTIAKQGGASPAEIRRFFSSFRPR